MTHRERTLPNLAIAAAVLLGVLILYVGSYLAAVYWTRVSFVVPAANERAVLRVAAILYRPAYKVDRKLRFRYWASRDIDDLVRHRFSLPESEFDISDLNRD